jgi:hypothetical protein
MASAALLVTGASGLVGRALGEVEQITPLRRGVGQPLCWDPEAGTVGDDGRPIGAVVHLAGENVGGKLRWNEAHKQRVLHSRVRGTRTLVDWLLARPQKPAVLVSASGITAYGDQGDRPIDEADGYGSAFLSEVCRGWEAEASRAREAGVRVVILRFGVVLARQGGALAEMRRPFSLGLGGPVGTGQQWFPWVHLDDVVGAIRFALRTSTLEGTFNLNAPGVVRQADFARALGRALRRPAALPTPAFALRLAFGEMADELLLTSQNARPSRLLAAGYRFQHPELGEALAGLLG